MKSFLIKYLKFLFICTLCLELFSRIIIDPLYYYSIDTYNLRLKDPGINVYKNKKTPHVDYLFIGSSRVPATINPEIIMQIKPEKVAVVAGRGYSTPGLHYQAIKHRIAKFPGFLKGAYVFLEYPGVSIYETAFQEDELTVYEPDSSPSEAMPHLLLPHLSFKDLFLFLKKSNNSFNVKLKMICLYSCSTFRTSAFIKERLMKMDYPLFEDVDNQLVSEGGIRNDNMETAQEEAIVYADQVKHQIEDNPILTEEKLNESTLSRLFQLIKDNGGTLILYKTPLHSVQQNVYSSQKARINHQVFDHWLDETGIQVIENDKFSYEDIDFPDTWHLSENRRDEFTSLLYEKMEKNSRLQ